jgi:hypothetical protein
LNFVLILSNNLISLLFGLKDSYQQEDLPKGNILSGTISGQNTFLIFTKKAPFSKVIRQHGFVNESRYETAAQVLFGLPPDLPVIAF